MNDTTRDAQTAGLPPPTFRKDINALRALAVSAVVLYHYDVPGFAGGFVGVDVFFVISGYLMMQIITSGILSNKFSIKNFYFNRFKRIAPGLLALCLTLIVLGWFILPTAEYISLGKHIKDSLLFISNRTYGREFGYFESDAGEKWLLHTWSLSIEFQFYILFPYICIGSHYLTKKRHIILWLIGGLAALSFSWCLTLSFNENSFFDFPSRTWELLSGSLCALAKQLIPTDLLKKTKHIQITGLAIILGSIVDTPEAGWPNHLTILPIVGTSLVLISQLPNASWCNIEFIKWAGSRSYSIYLWHWPVLVFLKYFYTLSNSVIAVGILASLILAEIIYRVIEKPTHELLWVSKKFKFTIAIAWVVLIGLSLTVKHDGVPERLPANVRVAELEANNDNKDKRCMTDRIKNFDCILGSEKPTIILVGDSHANTIITSVRDSLSPSRAAIATWWTPGCPTLKGAKRFGPTINNEEKCERFNRDLFEKLENIDKSIPLLISNRLPMYIYGYNEPWKKPNDRPLIYFNEKPQKTTQQFLSDFRESYISTMCELGKNRSVFVLRPTPEFGKNVPQVTARNLMRGTAGKIQLDILEYRNRNSLIWKIQNEARDLCKIKIINPIDYICNNDTCPGTLNHRPLYVDDNHLSEYGNRLLIPMFKEAFSDIK